MNGTILKSALEFYQDCGIDTLTQNSPYDGFAAPTKPSTSEKQSESFAAKAAVAPTTNPQSTPEAKQQAINLAVQANSLQELATAIEEFNGLTIKNTATQMVFGRGDPHAPIMIIGEAPTADEDRQGMPFIGNHGELLTKMLTAIGASVTPSDKQYPVYLTNMVNWRPPGNRSLTEQEVDIAVPFIEKHIALVKPKIVVLMGTLTAQALLNKKDGITKLRGNMQKYTPITKELMPQFTQEIQSIATFHPSYLLKTPVKKREAWLDLQQIQQTLTALMAKGTA
ncbi:MAG: uracil-DNA glycosylase [Micavibrio sp.]|nr:uracil-DNA glycosylase [Micavibrio sp.]|tara:strand:- start:2194 stop:3039 length:846 start_codon:yes stop_codon:yes gene_type:complete